MEHSHVHINKDDLANKAQQPYNIYYSNNLLSIKKNVGYSCVCTPIILNLNAL